VPGERHDLAELMAVYRYLTEETYKSLMETRDKVRRLPPSPPKQQPQQDDHQAPEVYVARTPDGGITGMVQDSTGTGVGDHPGVATCEIYKRITVGGEPELVAIPGLTKAVHNIATSDIPGNTWVLVTRDKGGTWWVTGGAEPGGGDTINIYIGGVVNNYFFGDNVTTVYINTTTTYVVITGVVCGTSDPVTLVNNGPGTVFLPSRHYLSSTENQFHIPDEQTVVLRPDEAAIILCNGDYVVIIDGPLCCDPDVLASGTADLLIDGGSTDDGDDGSTGAGECGLVMDAGDESTTTDPPDPPATGSGETGLEIDGGYVSDGDGGGGGDPDCGCCLGDCLPDEVCLYLVTGEETCPCLGFNPNYPGNSLNPYVTLTWDAVLSKWTGSVGDCLDNIEFRLRCQDQGEGNYAFILEYWNDGVKIAENVPSNYLGGTCISGSSPATHWYYVGQSGIYAHCNGLTNPSTAFDWYILPSPCPASTGECDDCPGTSECGTITFTPEFADDGCEYCTDLNVLVTLNRQGGSSLGSCYWTSDTFTLCEISGYNTWRWALYHDYDGSGHNAPDGPHDAWLFLELLDDDGNLYDYERSWYYDDWDCSTAVSVYSDDTTGKFGLCTGSDSITFACGELPTFPDLCLIGSGFTDGTCSDCETLNDSFELALVTGLAYQQEWRSGSFTFCGEQCHWIVRRYDVPEPGDVHVDLRTVDRLVARWIKNLTSWEADGQLVVDQFAVLEALECSWPASILLDVGPCEAGTGTGTTPCVGCTGIPAGIKGTFTAPSIPELDGFVFYMDNDEATDCFLQVRGAPVVYGGGGESIAGIDISYTSGTDTWTLVGWTVDGVNSPSMTGQVPTCAPFLWTIETEDGSANPVTLTLEPE
jgi:hypothetical protein